MSGPLSSHRTPSRPVFNDLEVDNPEFIVGGENLDAEGNDIPEKITIQIPEPHPTKLTLVSVPLPVELVNEHNKGWHSIEIARQRHVLDNRLNTESPSKHAKGSSTGKLTSEQRRRRQRDARIALAARQRASIELHQRALDALAISEAMNNG